MPSDLRPFNRFDTELSAYERGRLAAGRGDQLEDCPYSDLVSVEQWQNGWRAKRRIMQRLTGIED